MEQQQKQTKIKSTAVCSKQPLSSLNLRALLTVTLVMGICFNLVWSSYLPRYRQSARGDPDDEMMDVDASIESPQGESDEVDNGKSLSNLHA